jgi:hypothetical protein
MEVLRFRCRTLIEFTPMSSRSTPALHYVVQIRKVYLFSSEQHQEIRWLGQSHQKASKV